MKRLAITALNIAVSTALLWLLFHRIALAPVIADLKRVRLGPAALVWRRVLRRHSCSPPAGTGSHESATHR